MKKYICTLSLLMAVFSITAQTGTSYTAFIQQDTAIKWAAECNKIIDLTPKVGDYSIKQFYLNKLKNGNATCYRLNDDKRSVSPTNFGNTNLQRQDWLNGLSLDHSLLNNNNTQQEDHWNFIDKKDQSKGFRVKGISKDSCCGCDESDAARVKQILYYKNNRLFTYNVFLSPLCARKEAGAASWYPISNVAYNPQPGDNKKIVLNKDLVLINTCNILYQFINGQNSSPDSILSIGSHFIIQQILEDISSGKIKAYDPQSGKLIPAKKITTWRMGKDSISVPVFDSNGNIKGSMAISRERNPNSLSQIRVQQEWYFDFKNEKLYSRIKWVELLEEIYTSTGIDLGTVSFCRIYY